MSFSYAAETVFGSGFYASAADEPISDKGPGRHLQQHSHSILQTIDHRHHARRLLEQCGTQGSNDAFTACTIVANALHAAQRAANLAQTAATSIGASHCHVVHMECSKRHFASY